MREVTVALLMLAASTTTFATTATMSEFNESDGIVIAGDETYISCKEVLEIRDSCVRCDAPNAVVRTAEGYRNLDSRAKSALRNAITFINNPVIKTIATFILYRNADSVSHDIHRTYEVSRSDAFEVLENAECREDTDTVLLTKPVRESIAICTCDFVGMFQMVLDMPNSSDDMLTK